MGKGLVIYKYNIKKLPLPAFEGGKRKYLLCMWKWPYAIVNNNFDGKAAANLM